MKSHGNSDGTLFKASPIRQLRYSMSNVTKTCKICMRLISRISLKVCYHGKISTILLFYSTFRTTPEVLEKLYFVEICKVTEKLWLFNHKRADFWLPNFGFKSSLLSLLNKSSQLCYSCKLYGNT